MHDNNFIQIQGYRIEYQLEPGDGKPVMVFLHEGLGSVSMWKDFPAQCARACGCRALVYSRYGYGRSDALTGPRQADYMHDEALKTLPELLERLGIERPIVFGHSDGASIALIFAGRHQAGGVIALAPHVMVEEAALAGIREMNKSYRTKGLRDRLAKYHDDPDSAFWGWSDVWLSPAFRDWNIEEYLTGIRCPVLAVQGFDDEYGTMEQIHRIQAAAPRVEVLKLENCRHSPHRDRAQAVIEAAARVTRDTPNGEETRRFPAI